MEVGLKDLPKVRKKVSQSELKKVLLLAKPEAWNLSGAVILLLASSAITMSVPFALGKVIDLIYNSDKVKMRENINIVCGVLLAVFIVGGLCNFGRVYLMNVSAQKITKALREKVFHSIMKQEVAFFDRTKTGELINRLTADTLVVSNCVTNNISDGLRSLVMVVTGMSMMFYLSPFLALISLCVVPPIAGMAIVYGRFIKKMTIKVQDALADAAQVAEERIANIRTVKAFSKELREVQAYHEKLNYVLALALRESLARGIFFGMAGLSGNAVALIVLYSGGVMVSDNSLTVGGLSAFLLYAAYIGISIGGLSSFYSELNKGLGASTRLWELIERDPKIVPYGGLRPKIMPTGEINFENVVFSYPSRPDQKVLNKLSLRLNSGKITAVVGSSGSGKSTLALLLLGLYVPNHGSITIDNIPVGNYDPCWLRSHIGTVAQEPVLFSGSIRENIGYGAVNPSSLQDEDFYAVLKEANAFNFVTKELSDGLDTLVGERGIMLSGGQKQRVAIARALIKNPRILLLDEATSALDAESEHLVQEALERVMKGRTVLTIAHRLSTIKNADQIAVLQGGSIVELGSYDELINKDGVFRNLIKHQTFQPN
ncbi:ATP-binding cassette sub-family B member 10, mitochondrial isoform X2 [Cimex lectularius]|nr:ATP-binding cassette sub-family B member 10, mitochondrial isoform X2 [Cimex lectularius]